MRSDGRVPASIQVEEEKHELSQMGNQENNPAAANQVH